MEISEKEYAVIQQLLNAHIVPDQRTIASKSGISLGLTNIIIKRLIKKGFVKIQQLNRRKIRYILTPKGFAEKARKSYDFTKRTINIVKNLKESIKSLIISYITNQKCTLFEVRGNDEIRAIVESAIKEINHQKKTSIKLLKNTQATRKRTPINNNLSISMICHNGKTSKSYKIDLIKYLSSNTEIFYQN